MSFYTRLFTSFHKRTFYSTYWQVYPFLTLLNWGHASKRHWIRTLLNCQIVQFALNVILDPWNTFSSVFAHSIIAVRDPLVTNIKLKVPRSAVGWTFYSQLLTLSRRTCRLFALIFFNLFIFRMTRFFSHFIPNF